MPEKMRKAIGVILLVSLISTGFMSIVKEYISIPTNVAVFEKQKHSIDTSIEASAMLLHQPLAFQRKRISWILQDKRREKPKLFMILKDFLLRKQKLTFSLN